LTLHVCQPIKEVSCRFSLTLNMDWAAKSGDFMGIEWDVFCQHSPTITI
jgi:hypothetical protein